LIQSINITYNQYFNMTEYVVTLTTKIST